MISKGTIIENQIYDKILELEKKHNIKLSTTQKILLSIGGPITTILDALFGKVYLFMLNQEIIKADKDIAEVLEINEGDDVDFREVIVHKNGRPLVYAVSYIPMSRCLLGVIDDLQEEKLTTGNILKKYKIETLREIKSISIKKSTPMLKELFKTDEDMLTREYVILQHGKIKIWTKEAYPLCHFKD